MEQVLRERGLIDDQEIAAGHSLHPGKPLKRKLTVADVPKTLVRGRFGRASTAPARFKLGDRVRAKNIHPRTHARLVCTENLIRIDYVTESPNLSAE